jgi:hypothetical protein
VTVCDAAHGSLEGESSEPGTTEYASAFERNAENTASGTRPRIGASAARRENSFTIKSPPLQITKTKSHHK